MNHITRYTHRSPSMTRAASTLLIISCFGLVLTAYNYTLAPLSALIVFIACLVCAVIGLTLLVGAEQ